MMNNKRIPAGGLLLAGLAAFAYYKYSKMSEQDRKNLVGNLKEKGKKLYDQYVPEDIKNAWGKKDTTAASSSFTNGSGYTG